MSPVNHIRFKVANRRYSQVKKTVFNDLPSAETVLDDNATFYRQMFERNRAVKLVVDPTTGNIVKANQAACEFYGYTYEQLKALSVNDITVLEKPELLADMQRTVIEKGKTLEARHRLASGEIRDVEIFSGTLEINNKAYLYAIIQDISARKQAEKALRESEAKYRLFARNMPDSAVFMFDNEMRYTLAEGPFLKRFGSLYENIVGKTLEETLPEEALKSLVPIHQRALNGESFSFERVLKDYAYEAFVTPVRDDDGRIIGGMILSHDITKQVKAEKALREGEALYRLLAEHMPNTSVLMFDMDMRYTLVEGSMLNRMGSVSETVVGKTPQEILPQDTLNFVLPIYKRALQGESFSYERAHKPYAYQVYVSPVRDENGQTFGGMLLSIDITDFKRTEEDLRASEQRFYSLVDLAPVGIIQTDLTGKRVFCNSHWCEMTGITLEQALSDDNYETIYPEDLSIAATVWDNMIATNRPFSSAIFRYQRPDQSTIWVSGSGRPLWDSHGKVTGYLGTVTDISEHKQLESALLFSESRFRTLIDFAPVGIVEVDLQGHIMLTNAHWSKLSGISEEQAIVDDASATLHPDDVERVQAINQHMLETGVPVDNLEYRFLHPDGKVVWVSDSSRPVKDLNDIITGHIITMTNITERKRLENDLRQKEEHLRIITDNIADLVTQTNSEGILTFVSPSYKTHLGYEPQSLLGRNALELMHEEDIPRMIKIAELAIENNTRQFTTESRILHAEGHYISVEIVGKFLFEASSQFLGGVFISRDITERKRLQNLVLEKEKLQTALDKELELGILKTRMMERVAHEFRTPLAVILSTTETFTYYFERLTPDQRTTKSNVIRQQIQRITDMLDEIGLVINGIFTPDQIRLTTTDLSALCRQLTTELERQFNQSGKYALDLPETLLAKVDAQVISKVLMHILRNAARFSDASSIINVKLTSNETGIELDVTDSGIGILPEELPRIFEPFFRGTNINEISGLGVGLAIARAAIEAHGGTITVESVPRQGSTFIIRLPG